MLYLYPVIHMLLEICEFLKKHTVEDRMKPQDRASGA